MSNTTRAVRTVSLATLFAAAWAAGVGDDPCAGATGPSLAVSRASESPPRDRLPLAFEENRGQTAAEARFLARASGFTAFITPTQTVLSARDDVVRMHFVGADEAAQLAGARTLPGKTNYFVGSDRTKWVTDVRTYDGVVVRGAWPGIDVRWRGDATSRLTYDVVLAAGADVSTVAFRLDGAHDVSVDADGSLRAATASGELRQTRPTAWQTVDGARRPVDVAFAVRPDGCVGFEVGAHDAARALTIDPSVTWSTYLGGSKDEDTFDEAPGTGSIAVDGAGAVYVAGRTKSADFPVASGVQSAPGGTFDVFVTKIAPDGAAIVWSTYLGGGESESVDSGLAVDASGAVYVAGTTKSTDFPTQSALQPTLRAPTYTGDAFVTKIAASGSSLVWSTFLGGTSADFARAIAVDASGAVLVVGDTFSPDFPTASAFQASPGGTNGGDAFVSKISADGTALLWSTYLGGSMIDEGRAIVVDATGAVCVAGLTTSKNFPTASAFQAAHGGGYDVFLTRFSASGSLLWSTYLGGSQQELAYGLAVDSRGALHVVGTANSSNFPTKSPLPDSDGTGTAFLAKFEATGALVRSTRFGAWGDGAAAVTVDWAGAATVVGSAGASGILPIAASQAGYGGGYRDAFVARFDPDGASMTFATYLGGSLWDYGTGVAADASGNVFVTGLTGSTDFRTASPLQTAFGGGSDDRFVVAYPLGATSGMVAPSAPMNLVATYSASGAVTLSWTDTSPIETRFRVDRRPDGYTFTRAGAAPADAEQFTDTSLFPDTTYSYRVRAENSYGVSRWTEEARVTTDSGVATPPLPDAPSDFAAAEANGTIALVWKDNSSDEVLFEVERKTGGADFVHVEDVPTDFEGTFDAGVHPGWPSRYRVRAVSLQGPSGWSNTVTASPPPTIAVAMVAGRLSDSRKRQRDRLKVVATYDVALDPLGKGLEVFFGDDAAPLTLSIPAFDPAWSVKTKKGAIVRATWRSVRGALPKATVVVDFVRRRFTVTFASAEFPAPPTTAARLLLAGGADGGAAASTWTARRNGVLVLAPK